MGDFGPFRPLRPYTEADRSLFFGRERELADLAEKLAADRPSVLLAGEPGIGKTSLVRAGLLPSLKSRGVGCGYLDCNQLEENQVPSGGGAAGSLMVLDDLGAALDEGPRFDKLLLVLKKAGAVRGLKILFVIDDPDLWRLDSLEKLIGSVGGTTARVRLGRLDQARVGDIIERSVLGGGAYFEAGLSHEMAVDVCRRGDVSPSELQVVAATSVALHLNTLKAYRRSGGAEAVVWRFFERACSLAGQSSRRAAARVLAELASLDSRAVASRDQLARAAGVDEGSADKLAALLGQEHLVRREGEGYLLSSEWSRSLARAYTGEARGRGVAARLLLRRKIDGGGLLSIGNVREVKRYAGTLDADEERLVKRSVQVGLLVTALILSLPIAALVLLYSSAGRSYYLDAAPGPGASVVARLGRGAGAMAWLPHSPAFGSVIADSGFTRAALKDGLPGGAGPRAGDDWLRRLEAALDRLPHAAVALILDGDVKPLALAYADEALRPAVVGAVGAAGKGAPEEIALLRKALSDPSEDVRRRAVGAGAALERRAPGSGVDVLAAGLKDNSPSVRALALHEVERLPDEQSAPLLASALAQTSDPVVRKNALEAIGAQVARTPPAAAKLGLAMLGPARGDASAILSRLLDGNGPSADAAAAALGEVALNAKAPDDARIEALKMLRRRDKTPAGLEAITGSPKLMAALMPLVLRNKPEDAQAKVAEAMKGPVPLRVAAAAAIGLLPKTVDTPKLLKALQYDSNQEVHAEAVRALPVLGREALALLVKEAKGAGPDIEKAAVETIGTQAVKLGVASAAQALESVVKGARPSTRRAAIEALGRIAEQKSSLAAGALGRLVRDKVADVRADAAGALGDVLQHGGKEAIAALRSVSKDPDPATRKRAAGALGRAKGALATPAAKALAAFAGDAEASVRLEAASALGALGAAAREGNPIAALVGDKDAGVRAAGRKAAQQIGGGGAELDRILLGNFAGAPVPDKIEIATTAGMVGAASTVRAALADPDAGVRRAAAEHAGGLGGANVAALSAALGDVDAAVRVAAVRGLVGAKAGQALAQAARSPDLDVRAAALEAVGEVGGAQARTVLEGALGDASERVRVAAVRGLTPLGSPNASARDPQVGELLEKALHDPSRDVREAAGAGLGLVWSALPPSELALRLREETDADRRYAAAIALARLAEGPKGADARKLLDDAAQGGTPGARLSARIGRAFAGRADDLVPFLRLLRDGN